jgi:cytoskeletal protein CcmA (bactofilin family)
MAKKDTTDGQPAGGDLVIGEGVQFSGQIRACERLIVSGRVDAEFPGDCLEIRDGGRYRGEARVRSAEIHGTFEGTLRVEGTLSLGATASVSGAIRYDTLEIAAGGELRGDVDRIEPDRTTAQASEQESAAGQGATAGNLTVGV